jgi:hypothetical protein
VVMILVKKHTNSILDEMYEQCSSLRLRFCSRVSSNMTREDQKQRFARPVVNQLQSEKLFLQ